MNNKAGQGKIVVKYQKYSMNQLDQTQNSIFDHPLIFLSGATGIGKTDLALQLAAEFHCEIIGVDSMQIYKYMDIGTAKPTKEEMSCVPHYLVDCVPPDQEYNANCFVNDCTQAINRIRQNGRIPLLAGGTGLYFKSLEEGIFTTPQIDPKIRADLQEELVAQGSKALYSKLKVVDKESAKRIHWNDKQRITRALEIYYSTGVPWSDFLEEHNISKESLKEKRGKTIFKIGLEREREELYDRINHRVQIMVDLGLLEEVQQLRTRGYDTKLKSMQSLGYRHINAFLDGEWTWEQCVELLARDTRRYAKRQCTWFKADKSIHWFHPSQKNQIFDSVHAFLSKMTK